MWNILPRSTQWGISVLFVVSEIPPKTTKHRKSSNRLQTVGFDVPSVLCDCWSIKITLEGSVTLQNCLEGYFGDVIVSKICVKNPQIWNAPKSFQTSLNYAAIVSTFRLIYRGHYRRYLNPDGVARLLITAEQYQKSSINPQKHFTPDFWYYPNVKISGEMWPKQHG